MQYWWNGSLLSEKVCFRSQRFFFQGANAKQGRPTLFNKKTFGWSDESESSRYFRTPLPLVSSNLIYYRLSGRPCLLKLNEMEIVKMEDKHTRLDSSIDSSFQGQTGMTDDETSTTFLESVAGSSLNHNVLPFSFFNNVRSILFVSFSFGYCYCYLLLVLSVIHME